MIERARAVRQGRWTLALSLILALLLGVGAAVAAVSFAPAPGSPITRSTPGASTDSSRLTAAPLDPDAVPDLVVASPDRFTTYLGPGALAPFTVGSSTPLAPAGATDLGVGDVQADGDVDVVVVGGSGVRSYLNSGGTFTAAGPGTDGLSGVPTSVATGKLDADAFPDVAAGLAMSGVALRRGDAAGRWLGPPSGAPATIDSSPSMPFVDVALGDLDADGDDDLAAVNASTGRVVTFRNDGAGGFPQRTLRLGSTAASPQLQAVAIADVDGDGRADVVTSDRAGSGLVSVLPGAGDGTIGAPVSVASGAQGTVQRLAVGDLNRDGKADVALTDTFVDGVLVFEGAGTTTLTAPVKLAAGAGAGANPQDLALADFDADGGLDLAVTSSGGKRLDVLRNTTPAPAPVPDGATLSITTSEDGRPFDGLALGGAPVRFAATLTGATRPYTIEWTFGDGTTAVGATVEHAFTPRPISDPGHVKEPGAAERSSFVVSARARNTVETTPDATATVTVLPNTAPIADLVTTAPPEYDRLGVGSTSIEPDAPNDRIVEERFDLGDDSSPEVVRAPPGTPAACRTSGPGRVILNFPACVAARAAQEVVFNPYLVDLGTLQPVTAFAPAPDAVKLQPPGGAPTTVTLTGAAKQANAEHNANYLRAMSELDCPLNLCGAARDIQVGLTVTDRSGAATKSSKTFKTRRRTVPRADLDLKTPAGGDLLFEDPAGSGKGTELFFDAENTTVDQEGKAEWYVLQLGRGVYQDKGVCPGLAPQKQDPRADGGGLIVGGQLLTPSGLSQGQVVGKGLGNPNREVNAATGDFAAGARAARPRAVTGAVVAGPRPVKRRFIAAKPKGKRADFQLGGEPVAPSCVKGDFGVNDIEQTIVTKDPAALKLRIPKPDDLAPGESFRDYNALLTVYDELGAVGKVRLDGIRVALGEGKCLRGTSTLGALKVSGGCVDRYNSNTLLASQSAMSIGGITLQPVAGAWIVARKTFVKQRGEQVQVFASADGPTGPLTAGKYTPPTAKQAKQVQLLAGTETLSTFKLGPGAITGPGLLELPPSPAATYLSLDLTDGLIQARLAKGTARGTLDFVVNLPGAFAQPGGKATSDVALSYATDQGAKTGKVRGTAAQAGGREIVAIPAGTELGGITLPGFTLTRNGDQLTGTADGAKIPVLDKKVDLQFILSGGEFQQASGAISVQIPVGTTGAFIDRLKFTVVAKPEVRLIGNAHLTAVGGVVTADGELNLRPSPFDLRISGTASIIDTIPLGSAAVEIGGGRVAFAGQVGFSFGPASLSAAVGGAFSPSAFNVEGHGSACFFACVGADAVLSSRGAAACGTLDFGLFEVSAGFGLLYGRGPDIFATGCSIAPYRTNVLASGSRSAGSSRALVPGGPPETFPVPDKLPLVAVVAKAAPGRPAPRVIVTPPGRPPIALPADRIGGYRFDDATGSLIDVDPAASQTRVLVRDPAPGTWSIQAEQGSEPVVSVDVNRALPNVERAALTQVAVTDVPDATAQAAIGAGLVHGTSLAAAGATPRASAAAVKKRTPSTKALKKTYSGAAAGAVLKASAFTAADSRRVSQLAVKANLLPGETISFSERGDGVNGIIGTAPAGPSGVVDAKLLFDPARAETKQRQIDAFVTGADGIPRAVLRDVAKYAAKPLPYTALPKGVRVARVGKGAVMLRFPKSIPSVGRTLPLFRLDGLTDTGQAFSQTLTAADLRKAKGGARTVKFRGIGAGEALRLRIVPLDAAGNAKPGGATTLTLKEAAKAPVGTVILRSGAVRREAGKGTFVGAGAPGAKKVADPMPKLARKLPKGIG